MQEVQALKFARSFTRQVDLVVTQEWVDNWMRDLESSLAVAQNDGKDTENFLKAEEEFVRGCDEGRIIIRD
jgi:hypothetical protein